MKSLVPLFRGASQLEVTAALRHFVPARVDMNITLMEEGDEDPSLAVVLEGELEIRCGPVEIATARKGDLVGELSLFTGTKRTATVRTLTPCKVLTLDRKGYDQLLAANNTVAFSLELSAMAQVIRRLRRMTVLISRLSTQGDTERHPSTPTGRAPVRAPIDEDITAFLQVAPLFSTASSQALSELSAAFSTQQIPKGRSIVVAGQRPKALAMLLSGGVHGSYARGGALTSSEADIAPGALLDVGAMFDHKPSMFTWCADSDVCIALMHPPEWKRLLERKDATGSTLRRACVSAVIHRLIVTTECVLALEKRRRSNVREELAELLGEEADTLPESQFSHYGLSGQRSG